MCALAAEPLLGNSVTKRGEEGPPHATRGRAPFKEYELKDVIVQKL